MVQPERGDHRRRDAQDILLSGQLGFKPRAQRRIGCAKDIGRHSGRPIPRPAEDANPVFISRIIRCLLAQEPEKVPIIRMTTGVSVIISSTGIIIRAIRPDILTGSLLAISCAFSSRVVRISSA